MKSTLKEFSTEVRDAADIVDVVGSFVSLKRSGSGYKGLCPFHNEKTPSFHVHPGKQIFHCFGCGVGGDVIKFWMQHEKVGFRVALEQLGRKYNISIPRFSSRETDDKEERIRRVLLAVNEFALNYFHNRLNSEAGKAAREYLQKRGIDEEIIDRFKLGFAPDGWENILKAADKNGYSAKAVKAAGLALPGKKKTGHFYDRFRKRVMFPVFDLQGNCVAFGGRILGDGEPKYLNSPETKVYHKGRVLYGLNIAKNSLRQDQPALLVEGYMDLIALNRFGFSNAAATLGTALTEQHARLLKRFTHEVIFLYDGDEAGQRAMLRGCEVLLSQSLGVKVLILPEGEDPDTFLAKHGADAFREFIDHKKDFLDFFLAAGKKRFNIQTPEGKIGVLDMLRPALNRIHHPILLDDYSRRLGEALSLDQSLIKRHLRSRSSRTRSETGENIRKLTSENIPVIESGFLKIIIETSSLRREAAQNLELEWISSERIRNLVQKTLEEQEESITYSTLQDAVSEEDGAFLRKLALNDSIVSEGADAEILRFVLRRLELEHKKRIRHQLVMEAKKMDAEKEEGADIKTITDSIHQNSRDVLEKRKFLFEARKDPEP